LRNSALASSKRRSSPIVPDFRPLWREHAPSTGERVHLPTLAAAGGAAVVVIAALALAATDPAAEDVVLDMFAGV